MNIEEYYKISEKRNLPLRCPLVGRCGRYANTIYSLNDKILFNRTEAMEDQLINQGKLVDNYKKEKIDERGETFYSRCGRHTIDFCNGCPEVPLFDNEGIINDIPEEAIVTGFWDKEVGKKQKEYRHYSECSEFSYYHYEYKLL